MLDVVAEQLRRLVPVRRAAGGVEERDVVGIRELLLRGSGELAEPDREHGAPHRVLERLSRTEIGGERQRADDLRGADRLLDRACRLHDGDPIPIRGLVTSVGEVASSV